MNFSIPVVSVTELFIIGTESCLSIVYLKFHTYRKTVRMCHHSIQRWHLPALLISLCSLIFNHVIQLVFFSMNTHRHLCAHSFFFVYTKYTTNYFQTLASYSYSLQCIDNLQNAKRWPFRDLQLTYDSLLSQPKVIILNSFHIFGAHNFFFLTNTTFKVSAQKVTRFKGRQTLKTSLGLDNFCMSPGSKNRQLSSLILIT